MPIVSQFSHNFKIFVYLINNFNHLLITLFNFIDITCNSALDCASNRCILPGMPICVTNKCLCV